MRYLSISYVFGVKMSYFFIYSTYLKSKSGVLDIFHIKQYYDLLYKDNKDVYFFNYVKFNLTSQQKQFYNAYRTPQ